MKFHLKLILSVFVVIILQGASLKRIDYKDGIKNNVCKELKNNVLVYFIFVDTKETAPWTEFDMSTTLDSMKVAISWIEEQAKKNGQTLKILSDYYIGNEYTTIKKNLEYGTVYNTATTPNLHKGLSELNKWADGIAARVGKEVQISTKDGIPEIKNPKNKERLAAHLRDEKQVESVALLFMVNNYFRNDISLSINHMNNEDVEFAIVSYKYPSIIAQNILNLFGAADLSESIYRKNDKKIKLAAEYFPDDIMQDVYGKGINNFKIGEYTQYLIGWSDELNSKYQNLLTDNIVNF
ncbi:MAG: hypothetical protein JXA77_10295 [Bacteroidales bacterium]|nr:hypothetical protein [Bacteroidales bacterium]MBN2818262.1 hypothetical protein [Bacteroidales bacterium]